jgi:transcription-repair coupling factor (superfamily II helicase)
MDVATVARSTPVDAPIVAPLAGLVAHLERHEGCAQVIASLQAGHGGTLGGVWGSSCALVAATLTRALSMGTGSAPLVIVLPHAGDMEVFAEDLSLFTGVDVQLMPAWESEGSERVLHDQIHGQRLRLLKRLELCKRLSRQASMAGPGRDQSPETRVQVPAIILTAIQSLMQPVPSRAVLEEATREITVGESVDLERFAHWMVERGCHRTAAVELPGEFSIRGGILDIYPPDAIDPVRIELFGDEVESIRRFEIATQRSCATQQSAELTLLEPTRADRTHFSSYLPPDSWFLLVEPSQLEEEGEYYHRRLEKPEDFFASRTALAEVYKFPSVTASGIPAGSFETTAHLQFESIERFSGQVDKVRAELETVAQQQQVTLICETTAEIERLSEVFSSTRLMAEGRLHFVQGRLAGGFRMASAGVVLVSASQLFHRQELARQEQALLPGSRLGRAIDSFLQLREGDLVVHVAHGVSRYRGLKLLEKDGRAEDHLELEFHGGTRIYVPTSKIELVQKYVGGRKAKARLATIGGKTWLRQKKAAQQAVTDLASEMLDLQAARAARPGLAFPVDTTWQREFDAAFPYQETADQLSAIEAIKGDMQQARPMDRLLCGDVGFGKTELAIRAAFKAIDAGYQVAVLVPTTVLAEQHLRTFTQRMAEFPFEIATLSRFGTRRQQREILQRAAQGHVDLLIGTHRLVSPDVQFQNLGLIVIDEEQRFGVAMKERLKALRASVDVLTMSATPIPRTLHMSLLGVRNISNLETAPQDRLAVETRVARFDEGLIRHAILRELNRDGQVFFVHNRVHDIGAVGQRLQRIVPEATIGIGHGQMPEKELEEVMLGFVRHDFDLLLATTIIESGLDIPNANTIFIDDANRYGLADLHQLRGRVGRYKHRAYCYLLVDENRHLSPEAARRLRAIEEFSQMGAGFAISMRDLELRGAGNLLGTQQSGHIATVGYELYCSLLERAVRELKKLPTREPEEVSINLPVEAYFPRKYVPDLRTKIDLYRRVARITGEPSEAAQLALDDFAEELADRFGPLPESVCRLVDMARMRIWAIERQIASIHLEGAYLVLGYRSRTAIDQLRRQSGDRLRIVDAAAAYLPLSSQSSDPPAILSELKALLRPTGGGH